MLWQVIPPILSGILLILSFPKFNLFFLAWIAFIPLFYQIKKFATLKGLPYYSVGQCFQHCLFYNFLCFEKKQLLTSFATGFLSGLVAYSGILYWIVITCKSADISSFTSILILLSLAGYLAIYPGIFCAILYLINRLRIKFLSRLFIIASIWVILEYIRSFLFTGFPWALLGYSQWNFSYIIQICDITGIYGVSFLIMLVNISLFEIIFSKKTNYILIPTSIIIAVLIYGIVQTKTYSNTDKNTKSDLKILLLQGNIDQYKKWDEQYKQEIINAYTGLIIQQKEKYDLCIWPESSVPGYLLLDKDIFEWIKKLVLATNCPHIIGSTHIENDLMFNSVFLVSPDISKKTPDIKIINRYDKIHLVPFGETIPLQKFLSKYLKVLNELGDFTPGKNYTVFSIPEKNIQDKTQDTPEYKFSVNICFEMIFPEISRNFVKNGADFLVNITNDGWYLDTAEPYQHYTFNIFRAIENRRDVIRCGNTGISGLINKTGRIISKTKLMAKTTDTTTFTKNSNLTFYTKYGDIFVLLNLAFIISVILLKNHICDDFS